MVTQCTHHCVKSVRILSYSGLYFPAFGLNTNISPYSDRMPENTDQNNSKYRHFSRSAPLEGLLQPTSLKILPPRKLDSACHYIQLTVWINHETETYIFKTTTFTSNVTDETYKIIHRLNCDSNCLIYLLLYKCYGKLVGETTESFSHRWNIYKNKDRSYVFKEYARTFV